MSYEVYEGDDRSGGVITLYRFTVGPNPDADQLHYTDADRRIYRDGKPYEPVAIQRSKIQKSGVLDKADMTLTTARDHPVPRMFISYPPSYVLLVEVFEGHVDDLDREFLLLGTWRVLNSSFNNNGEAEMLCQPASTSLKRPGLRRFYQRPCPLDLYGPDCRATKIVTTCDLVSASGHSITGVIPPGGFATEDQAYITGIVQWVSATTGRTELRSILTILSEAPNFTITCNGPVTDIPATFDMIKGCFHTERTCNIWHGNIVNYGGQLWIPERNPVGTTSTYL